VCPRSTLVPRRLDANMVHTSGVTMNGDSPALVAAPVSLSMSPLQDQRSAGRHSRELTLIFLCARLRIDSTAEAQVKTLLGQAVDWDFLITTAHQHRVLPLVYRSLGRVAAGDVPEMAMQRLRNAFRTNAKRNLFLTSELLRVIDSLRNQGIPSIPYKGPAVASLVYGDLSLRQFADLDLIVPVKDAPRARALLVGQGYRPEKALSQEELVVFIRTEKDVTLLHDDLGVNLEIHWGITTQNDPIRIPPESLWERLETCAIAGRPVQTLRIEDLLLILCIHGAKHRWERLVWLCDVAEIVRAPRMLDWGYVIEKARRLGGQRILLLGLSLARELLGSELPANVLRAADADPVLKELSLETKHWFSEGPAPLDLGERERYFLRLREHWADRFRVALKQAKRYLALTARDNEALPLPGFLEWSRYVVRPIRLAGQYGITPFIRFFKGIFQS
jgi:hypothetical protein